MHKKTTISEINIAGSRDAIKAVVNCRILKAVQMSVLVLDVKGRVCWQMEYHLLAGQTELIFSLPRLRASTYNAWIEIEGQTWIRPFDICPKKNESKWKSLFSLSS